MDLVANVCERPSTVPTRSSGLLAEQVILQVREPFGENRRGKSDVDTCARVRTGFDQQLAGGAMSLARREMQCTVAVRIGGGDVCVACEQQTQHVEIASFRSVVQRGPAVGVSHIDAGARVEEATYDFEVAVANRNVQRGPSVAVKGVGGDAGSEKGSDRRRLVQSHRPQEVPGSGRFRSCTGCRYEQRHSREQRA